MNLLRRIARAGVTLRNALGWSMWTAGGYGGHYASTDPNREVLEQAFKLTRPATADQAIAPSLETLVAQARYLDRSAPMARAAVNGYAADLVGTGIGIEPDTGDPRIDDILVTGFTEWAECAGVNGESLWELQTIAACEQPTSGAALWRWLAMPELAREGQLPWRLLDLEVEWFAPQPVATMPKDHRFVHGVELDRYGRPVFYHLTDPEVPIAGGQGERVPADEIIHAYLRRRARQHHGEPGLASAIERLKQDDDIIHAELKGAKNGSGIALVVTRNGTNGLPSQTTTTYDANGNQQTKREINIPIGAVTQLQKGEDIKSFQLNRPNTDIQTFRGGTKGDIAGAVGVSRMWLDRDTSQAKYSSMRTDRMQSQKLLGPQQDALGRYIASAPYCRLVPYILLAAGEPWPSDPAEQRRLRRHQRRPDGMDYDDPVKDGDADWKLVSRNMATMEEVCGKRGRDWRRVARQRAKENKFLETEGLPIPTPDKATAPEQAQETQQDA